ncbi:hypothetical protein CWR43_08280 [Rhizobium sullae]|uniref:Uncharacterized protein n=1 Tax=Rhizobium sullae TaxID=50338 RepID=A0A2N0DE81_RHISU|nr:hypothetical protein CWR43_08280 [Rhizobium sullae]
MADAKLPFNSSGKPRSRRVRAAEIQLGPKIAFLFYLVKRKYDRKVNFRRLRSYQRLNLSPR